MAAAAAVELQDDVLRRGNHSVLWIGGLRATTSSCFCSARIMMKQN
jgi:hypothetical protein